MKMKKLLLGAVALFAVACAEKPIPNELDIYPENIEFWEVCEISTLGEIYNFLYNGEADKFVAEALESTEVAPLSSLLVREYPYKDREGKTQTAPVGGYIVAATEKENVALINEYLALDGVKEKIAGDVKLAWSNKNSLDGTRGGIFTLYALQGNGGLVPAMDGSGIVEAKAVEGMWGGFEVSITMNDRAAVEWANLTEKNIGKPLAIVMDNVVYSVPNVTDRIEGGKSSITGGFTAQEAEAFARALNHRALNQ